MAFADDCDDIDELREMIRPLGFVNRRSLNIINMSKAYIRGRWATPADLPGCGKYATDSWLIFVKNIDVDITDLHDKELRRYIHWRATGEYIPQDRTV
jgi:endonuclease III